MLEIDNVSLANADMGAVTESIKTNMINSIHEIAKIVPLFQRIMDAQYILKFGYNDNNDKPTCTVKIVPGDYN